MASGEELPDTSSLFERLVRLRDLSLFMPFIFGLTNTDPRTNPDQEPETESESGTDHHGSGTERIILINPFTQGLVVIEGASSLEGFLRDMAGKQGPPPASKASIEAMPCVDIESGVDSECAICLEEWEAGGVAKEMPCKHRFHGGCIEKWLGLHGSCPVCRYKMPVDEEDEVVKRTQGSVNGDEEGRERRRIGREVWVGFSLNGMRIRESNQSTASSGDSTDSSST